MLSEISLLYIFFEYNGIILRLYDPPLVAWLLSWCQCSYCYLVVFVQVELDLVLTSKQSAFQCAIRQAVREEQLIKNHMVLEHIRVLDRWKTEDLFIARQELQWIISPAGRENRSGHYGQLQKNC